ncbi:MAG: arsenate reductase (glutaredoxin) [Flavobacteriia bacterium]|jgi:arsenate reductase
MSEKITIFHNPRCSKSRESLDLLSNSNCEIEIVEYLKDVPSVKDLKAIVKILGLKPQDLIRKSEEEFKVHFQGKTLSDAEWIKAMVKYPKLIERPIVIKGNKAVIGRPPSLVLELI